MIVEIWVTQNEAVKERSLRLPLVPGQSRNLAMLAGMAPTLPEFMINNGSHCNARSVKLERLVFLRCGRRFESPTCILQQETKGTIDLIILCAKVKIGSSIIGLIKA